jgi:hypothetical protein
VLLTVAVDDSSGFSKAADAVVWPRILKGCDMNRLGIGAALLSVVSLSFAGEDVPPAGAAALASVIAAVQQAGCEAVTEISFDDGHWEVEALRGGKPVGLRMNAATRKILSEYADEPHPKLPAGGKSAQQIAQGLEQAGYSLLRKLEFETTGWEAEAQRGGQWRELILDLDGQLVSDEPSL